MLVGKWNTTRRSQNGRGVRPKLFGWAKRRSWCPCVEVHARMLLHPRLVGWVHQHLAHAFVDYAVLDAVYYMLAWESDLAAQAAGVTFCGQCGAPGNDDAAFCGDCGKEMRTIKT